MTSTARPALSRANTAADAARRRRAEWLIGIAEGVLTVDDLFTEMSQPDSRDLSKLTLRQVLLAVPGASRSDTDRKLTIMRRTLGLEQLPPRKMTLAWLFDPRCNNRRYQAYIDATHPDRGQTPWPGFPATPPPPQPTGTDDRTTTGES